MRLDECQIANALSEHRGREISGLRSSGRLTDKPAVAPLAPVWVFAIPGYASTPPLLFQPAARLLSAAKRGMCGGLSSYPFFLLQWPKMQPNKHSTFQQDNEKISPNSPKI